jgi:NAD(P)H-dependent FMN reductase
MKNSNRWPFPGPVTTKNQTGNHVRAWQDRLVESDLLDVSTGVYDDATADAFKALREALEYETPSEGEGDKKTFTEPKTGGTEGLWKAWLKADGV